MPLNRRKPPRIDLTLVNGPENSSTSHHTHPYNNHSQPPSPGTSTTYRLDGLSIGQDFMRYHGATTSSLSPSALRLEATIGRGMCSVVKRARDAASREPFALKIFPIQKRGDGRMSRRNMLEKELRALCSLDCDCLVRLVGAFFDGQEVTMVLEYMDRGSLQDFLNNRSSTTFPTSTTPSSSHPLSPLPTPPPSPPPHTHTHTHHPIPERTVASIAYQMLWGIAYLHYENMLHRDIKPANVLVNSAGEVKLSDFGISSKRREGDEMNSTVVGTTRYMSPERLRARPYGPASDLWSLGLVLLECATGRSPFEGISSIVELLLTVEESTVEELIPSHLSDGLKELLTACLQRIPERRIPADILIASPWFTHNQIHNLSHAVQAMREYIDLTYTPQDPECLSVSTMKSLLRMNSLCSTGSVGTSVTVSSSYSGGSGVEGEEDEEEGCQAFGENGSKDSP